MAAALDCIYLITGVISPNLVVLSASDYSEAFTMYSESRPYGFIVRGRFAYLNNSEPDLTGQHLSLPGHVTQIDLVRRTETGEFPTGRTNFDLAYARGKLYTGNAEDDTATVVDPVSRTTKTLEGMGNFPASVAATPDGSWVFVGDQGTGTIFAIDPARDEVDFTFATHRAILGLLATNEDLYVLGDQRDVFNGFGAYRRDGQSFAELWHADFGFFYQLALAGGRVFGAGRHRALGSVPLVEPHEAFYYQLGERDDQGDDDLFAVEEYHGELFVAGEGGLFRFFPADGSWVRVNPRYLRDIEIQPCPTTFTGDADCDEALTPADLTAQIASTYDTAAAHRCDADCNGDGRVGAADVVCAAQIASGPAPAAATSRENQNGTTDEHG
jgi:hypothetical protein